MDYSLASTRKIGKYSQTIITTWRNVKSANFETGNPADRNSLISILNGWHNVIDLLNYGHDDTQPKWRYGELKYGGLLTLDSEETNTDHDFADVSLSLVYIPGTPTDLGKPATLNFTLEKVGRYNQTSGNNWIVNRINKRIQDILILGHSDVSFNVQTHSNIYITSVIIDIY